MAYNGRCHADNKKGEITMSGDYKVDIKEALRLAEQGKRITEHKKAMCPVIDSGFTSIMPCISKDVGTLGEFIIACAEAERENNKPWIIQEINKWKRWFRRK